MLSFRTAPGSAFSRRTRLAGLALAALALAGCAQFPMPGARPATADIGAIEQAMNVADASAAAASEVPTITGIGYAVVSDQPARSTSQKRLMAIRAARIDATRNLTEQIHGMKISSRTTMIDAIVQNDTLRATVEGTIRGARTVRINPVGSDTYEVVLELDRDMIRHIVRAARG